MKQLMYRDVEIQGVEILISILGGLCCVGFIYPIGVVACVRRQKLAFSVGSTLRGST
jgi:hypothetical protein